MKNITTKLLSVSAAALLTSSFSSAAVYQITYQYLESSVYAATKPMVGGVSDPSHSLGPAGSPVLADHGITAPTPVNGTGWLNTTTGQIYMAPIDIEYQVVSGSFGYVGWSQTLNGSFSGNNFTMSGPAAVNGGVKICEAPTSSGCLNGGGVGAAPAALLPSQTYPDPSVDEFGDPVPGGPLTLIPVTFNSFSEGGTAQYIHQSEVQPTYQDFQLNITVGKVVYLPVPAAAWLFAPSVMALVAGKRLRDRKIKSDMSLT